MSETPPDGAPELLQREADPHAQHDPARLRRDALITSLVGFSVYATAIITSPLLARALGASGRGNLNAVQNPTMMFWWLLTFGFPLAAMYYARRYSARQLVMGAWAFSAVVGVIVIAILWPLLPQFLDRYDDATVNWFRAFLFIGIPFAPCYVAIDLQMALGRTVAYNVLRALPWALNFVGVVALALTGNLTLQNALISQFFSNLVWIVIVLTWCNAWPGPGFSRRVLGREIHYGSRVFVGSVSEYVFARLDQILLVNLVAPAALGRYSVAVNIASVSQPVAYALQSSVLPRLRAMASADESSAVYRQALRYAVLTSVAVSAAVAVLTPTVVPWIFGAEFRGAVAPLLLLLPGQIAFNLAVVFSTRLQAIGWPGRSAQGQAVGAVVTLVGLALFIRYGIVAAAIVTSVSQLAFMAYVGCWAHRGRDRSAHDEAADVRFDTAAS